MCHVKGHWLVERSCRCPVSSSDLVIGLLVFQTSANFFVACLLGLFRSRTGLRTPWSRPCFWAYLRSGTFHLHSICWPVFWVFQRLFLIFLIVLLLDPPVSCVPTCAQSVGTVAQLTLNLCRSEGPQRSGMPNSAGPPTGAPRYVMSKICPLLVFLEFFDFSSKFSIYIVIKAKWNGIVSQLVLTMYDVGW